jgi:hypothetical protein
MARIVTLDGNRIDLEDLSDNPGVLRVRVVSLNPGNGAVLTGPVMLASETGALIDAVRALVPEALIRLDHLNG